MIYKDFRSALKHAGLLTRDARMVERKKGIFMKEIRFSNQNMQNYYNEIMNMETSELNLIIAEKKVALDRNKNLLNVVMICYISFLILGLPQVVFPAMFSGDWGIVSYSILTLIAM
ncbi:TPA: 30S ribosomal protein S9, partial [Enterococcus faecium]|nr:30S ribosomal protein S9 [Enterococcus faecium]HCI1234146.1 30S ribosomal protein S9 [Enterococcus faecium]